MHARMAVRMVFSNQVHLIVAEEALTRLPLVGTRAKTRVSYTLGDLLRVDLTQVQQQGMGDNGQRHELEVEWLHARYFVHELGLHRAGQANQATKLASILLSNVRQLCQMARR